jgi:hypothetical protein
VSIAVAIYFALLYFIAISFNMCFFAPLLDIKCQFSGFAGCLFNFKGRKGAQDFLGRLLQRLELSLD